MRSREERAKKPDRHGKGKIIIMWLLFMPLFAIGVTCGYAIFNKNAYQSYAGEYKLEFKYETNDVNSAQDLVEGRIYTFTYQESEYSARIGIEKLIFNDDLTQYNLTTIGSEYDTTIRINYNYLGTNQPCIAFSPLNNSQVLVTTTQPLNFIYGNSNFNVNIDYLIPMISKCNEIEIIGIQGDENSVLSNVFYYSIDKVQESPLFNWANNNIIYTGMHSMCTTMNITSTFIPFILTYWILISIIYMLFDIEFTLLWKLHEKIHDLTESI